MRESPHVGDFQSESMRKLSAEREVHRIRIGGPDRTVEPERSRVASNLVLVGECLRELPRRRWRKYHASICVFLRDGVEACKGVHTRRRSHGLDGGLICQCRGHAEGSPSVKRSEQTLADPVINYAEARTNAALPRTSK